MNRAERRPRTWRRAGWALGAVGAAVVVAVAAAPATTWQSVGGQVLIRPIPRWAKVRDFLVRHVRYRALAGEITRGARTDAERVLTLLAWTRASIQKTPAGAPVVDDHILGVIDRGHGADYQRTDVFATLATYAGVPAFWHPVPARGPGGAGLLAFALVDGRWAAFDVVRGVAFRDGRGELLDARQVVPGLRLPPARPLRAELQMPWPRLLHEVTGGWRG